MLLLLNGWGGTDGAHLPAECVRLLRQAHIRGSMPLAFFGAKIRLSRVSSGSFQNYRGDRGLNLQNN